MCVTWNLNTLQYQKRGAWWVWSNTSTHQYLSRLCFLVSCVSCTKSLSENTYPVALLLSPLARSLPPLSLSQLYRHMRSLRCYHLRLRLRLALHYPRRSVTLTTMVRDTKKAFVGVRNYHPICTHMLGSRGRKVVCLRPTSLARACLFSSPSSRYLSVIPTSSIPSLTAMSGNRKIMNCMGGIVRKAPTVKCLPSPNTSLAPRTQPLQGDGRAVELPEMA